MGPASQSDSNLNAIGAAASVAGLGVSLFGLVLNAGAGIVGDAVGAGVSVVGGAAVDLVKDAAGAAGGAGMGAIEDIWGFVTGTIDTGIKVGQGVVDIATGDVFDVDSGKKASAATGGTSASGLPNGIRLGVPFTLATPSGKSEQYVIIKASTLEKIRRISTDRKRNLDNMQNARLSALERRRP